MFSKVEYGAGCGGNREYPGCTTEMTHLGQSPCDEKIWRGEGKTRHRAEQKSVEMITTIVRKFTRGRDLVIDTCTVTLSTAKACLIMSTGA